MIIDADLASFNISLINHADLTLFQHITNQPSVLYCAASTFQSAGIPTAFHASTFQSAGILTAFHAFQSAGIPTTFHAIRVSILLGLLKLIMTGVAVIIVDRLGRKSLLPGGVYGDHHVTHKAEY